MTTQALDYSAEELGRHGLRLEAQVVECRRALAAGDRDGILASLRRLKLETAATRRVVRAAFADAVADAPPALANGHRPGRARAEQQAQKLASAVTEPLVVAPSEPSPAPTRGSQPSHLHKLSERDPLTLPEATTREVAPAAVEPECMALPPAAAPLEAAVLAHDTVGQPVHAEVLCVVAAHPGQLAPDELEEHQSVGLRYAAGYLADSAAQLVAAGRLKLVKGKLAPVG